MSAAVEARPRAFAVWFKDLTVWSVGSFVGGEWVWPDEFVKPLRTALRRKQIEADRARPGAGPPLVTLRFDGTIEARETRGAGKVKGKLFAAEPGDVVFSKIDVRNGAIGVVPEGLGRVAVSAEFPVYEVAPEVAEPEYIKLLFRTERFRRIVNGMVSGASGRKRVQPSQLEQVSVPLPPLEIQRAIVARWRQARFEIAVAFRAATAIEQQIPTAIYEIVGSPLPAVEAARKKVMVLSWSELERWSFNYLDRSRQGLSGFTASKYPIVPLSDCIIETMNGFCIKPVTVPTPHKMLKLNALRQGGLDTAASKFVAVPEKVSDKFSLRAGDLLICRSVGSYEHIAKCALVEYDDPAVLFPDIIIRARFNQKVDPAYVREIIQTPLGRSYFQANARTSVGMWKIGADDIHSFPLPLPPLYMQRTLVSKVNELRAEAARVREDAARLRREAVAEVEAFILGVKKI